MTITTLPMQQLLQHLFQAKTLEEVPRERLEEMVSVYPSFPIAHYLLSRKLRAEDADHFVEETRKTNLYFGNPFWLQWLLRDTTSRELSSWSVPGVIPYSDQDAAQLPASGEATDTGSAGHSDPALPAEEPVEKFVTPAPEAEIAPAEEDNTWSRQPSAETVDQTEESVDNSIPSPEHSMDFAEVPEEMNPIHEIHDVVHGVNGVQTDITAVHAVTETPDEGVGVAEEISSPEEISVPEEVSLPEEVSIPAETTYVPDEESAGIAEGAVPDEAIPELTGRVDEVQAQADEAQVTVPAQADEAKIPAPAPAHAPETKQRTPAAGETPFVFQAFHTIDYFASQGIKLMLDENPGDKLGKQLKSFTDWLKDMRRLPQKDRSPLPDLAAEQNIQVFAAHSIERKDIVTEAMAEVLAKQGMREKASEVYHKLSLLNPGKSAYFAAKIEQLKID